ncbi:hypothetical protein CDD81_6278 [Ophiocordyceps australis]|uniref:Chorismate synthase protein n=1 Tax=Ophiocordyceps australis TaxID=1399860 RepID=A0A2C5Y360_9HYPO|nr:hypothetical protein CDD81_6278 [Ophiocordyceps australis]
MAISWDVARSVALVLGPFLLPKAIGYYRSLRAASLACSVSVQAAPQRSRLALAVLATLAVVFVVYTLPILAPENLFVATQSRLQIPVDVLFNRVASLRPAATLSPTDQALRARFVNLESRLLYFKFGPAVLAECPFCNSDEPRTYFYYALPVLLTPHLANLAAIAAVTSPSWTGQAGAQWRIPAAIAASVIAALDIYLVNSYNHQENARSTRLYEIDAFFWSMRSFRFIALAALDALLGWLIWLSSTNRAFTRMPSPAQRIESINRSLSAVKSKLTALGIVKNTALRDEDLRLRSNAYWTHEVRLMSEVMEEREVIEGVNDALSNRINMHNILKDAETYSLDVLPLVEQSAAGAAET